MIADREQPRSSGASPPELTQVRQVLVVSEHAEFRSILAKVLARHGYRVALAASAREALEQLSGERSDLMLLDVRVRDVSGGDVLAGALATDPDLGVVMLLGDGDPARAAECLEHGALDCLTAPPDATALDSELGRVLRWWDRLARERREWRQAARDESRRNDDLKQAVERQERFTVATLDALVNAREARNPYLAGHSHRVATVAASVASQLGLPPSEVAQVRHAARLHDLGMIGVRDDVLNKRSSLTDKEYQHVKRHSTIGAWILAPLTHLGPVVDFVQSHHERWDGRGYPDGLGGAEIPLGGRIIHAAEVFDALTTDRPYQDPLPIEEAVRRMRGLAEQVLDATVVDALAGAGVGDHGAAFDWAAHDAGGFGGVLGPGDAPSETRNL